MTVLASREWGDPGTPAVVCVHGMQTSSLLFRRLAPEYLSDRRVLAVDLRGHGDSTADPPWRVETHIADVVETAAAAGIKRAAYVGHSFGGRVVFELAAAHPERVESLVILDNGIAPSGGVNRGRLAEIAAPLEPMTLDEAVASWRSSVPLAPEELLRECVLDSLESLADGRYRWRYVPHVLAASAGDAAIPAPPPAHVPTLLVLGADSPMVTDAQLAWLRTALGDLLQTVTVPGRHSVLLDALPQSGEAIRAFVTRAAAPAAA